MVKSKFQVAILLAAVTLYIKFEIRTHRASYKEIRG